MTIFFYGANTYELGRQLQDMIHAYVSKSGSDFGLERIDGQAATYQALASSLQASPFLANSRLVVIEGLAMNKSMGPKLPSLMSAVPKSTVAVFVDREVDLRTLAYKQLAKADKVVKFEPLTGPKLMRWMQSELETLGGTADTATLRELVDVAGEDQWRLGNELNKLVNYNPAVTVQAVRELVAIRTEQSIFELVEAMTSGALAPALAGYHRLLKQRESEIYVLTMIQWQLRNLLLAKSAPSEMSPAELAKAAGMSPYVAGKMAAAQGRMDMDVLTTAFSAAADCEYDIKSGRQKAEEAVEQLIYRVATASKA
jgi:DNA polymerase III delta subunit